MTFGRIPDWGHLRNRYIDFWNGVVSDNLPIAHIQNPNPNKPELAPWINAVPMGTDTVKR